MAATVAAAPMTRNPVRALPLIKVAIVDVIPAEANCNEPTSASAVPLANRTGATAREVEGPRMKPILQDKKKKHASMPAVVIAEISTIEINVVIASV